MITKCLFPVAGYGTRFLPATKAMPKEMLPIVDKPLIQYAVEEALASGIEQLIFVTGSGKTSLALDTLYAECQRCYIESFSAYTRQFLQRHDGGIDLFR